MVIKDYRNKSVLGGIAAVGVLGSMLSAFFIIWFGGSLFVSQSPLLHKHAILITLLPEDRYEAPDPIRYRSPPRKPKSTFVEVDKRRVSCVSIRPTIPKNNSGLLSFVSDVLIDLDVVAEQHPF